MSDQEAENQALASENSEDVKKFAGRWADVPFDQMPPGIQRRITRLVESGRGPRRPAPEGEPPVPEP